MFKHRRRRILRISPPAIHAGGVAPPILLDELTGTGALTDHTPDIYPAGSSWAIIGGSFGNLSGGYLPYVNTTLYGTALIYVGATDYEIRWRSKYTAVNNLISGIMYRASSVGGGYWVGYVTTDSLCHVYGSAPSWIDTPAGTVLPYTSGNYYTNKIVAKGSQLRFFDENGVCRKAWLAGVQTALPTYGYVGFYTIVKTPLSSWDWIEVKHHTAPWIEYSIIGDSMSNDISEWPGLLSVYMNNALCKTYNHAQSGSTVTSQMAGQAAQCVADNADYTMIQLGTNDGTGNIQAAYLNGLNTLWNGLHKPIYAMGIFPRDPDANRSIPNGYILAAVNQAIAAGVNVTYWNTDGWIDPTPGVDTSDGLHPNAAGQLKIRDQVYARL